MNITSSMFEAYLKCPTKCFLRAHGESGAGNLYADWVRTKTESYKNAGIALLSKSGTPEDISTGLTGAIDPKTAKWRLAVNFPAQVPGIDTGLNAIERIPSPGRGKSPVFIPIRFVFRNKLTADDKMLLAFDAFALSSVLGRTVDTGNIIHGDDRAVSKIKITGRARVGKSIERIVALLATATPPELILRKHCAECEYQNLCRQKAVEKDDLSLLAGMNEKERKKLNSKGIFTVTQLSYTFRPRRRPKKVRDKKEKYHHSLKALAIREKKIHLVGTPELKIEGTPVYLDVEGLPDHDFYYLIGVRIGEGESAVQHSLWANCEANEKQIWADFLAILRAIENPVLIHYGSYETTFLNRMRARYGNHQRDDTGTDQTPTAAVNLLSTIFANIYYPTFTNGLKEIAGFLGFRWSEEGVSGKHSIIWRHAWKVSRDVTIKKRLVTYNAEDCEALALIARTIHCLSHPKIHPDGTHAEGAEVVRTDDVKPPFAGKWREFKSPVSELEFINKAAHWDYQRDRIYTRSSKTLKRTQRKKEPPSRSLWRVDKVIKPKISNKCPFCQRKGVKQGAVKSQTVQTIVFGRDSVKRRVIRYEYHPYRCSSCKRRFGFAKDVPKGRRPGKCKYSKDLLAYLFYHVIELTTPLRSVIQCLSRLFGLRLSPGLIACFKERIAADYSETQQQILRRIVNGGLVHVDETHVTIKRRRCYVWVFTNLHEVAYIYSDTREGELVRETLKEFKGVLVTDFYAVYDALDCPQQKCLIHLVRDLNEELLRNPYDEDLKWFVENFGQLLRTIVDDVDRRGLKKHFLRKHLSAVDRFYRKVVRARDDQSPTALACRARFEKNRDKLFTFLKFDGVPWNNNNAEHAIKAFARLRDVIEGSSTEKGIREYLILLSICQTCKYQGLDFLDFLRSGEKDIEMFAQSKRRKRLSGNRALIVH